ncbi:MAG: DUF1963 domain-containing protein [Ruminococcus sp.]|nr:DUF1963 domain-containing protein [Ruminococcus sp.]
MTEFEEALKDIGREALIPASQKFLSRLVLLTEKEYPAGAIPVGASKCGGFPDLPPEIEYPLRPEVRYRRKGGPLQRYDCASMQLIAQINLRELAESGADPEHLFPQTGMLYYFWSCDGATFDQSDFTRQDFTIMCFGKDGKIVQPEEYRHQRVIYWDGDMSQLRRVSPPCPYNTEFYEGEKEDELPEYAIGFEEEFDYSRDIERDEQFRALEEEHPGIFDDTQFHTDKLLGIPTGGNYPELCDDEVNLLQFGFQYGCLWNIYWIIKRDDLLRRDFDKAYLDFDCD